ncbi:hypothetical protein ABW636_04135 [Aquimarina sp. 2201CG1-2-11]|uniref:hypothetical protein n=1 Tax=Aquimarina discodermiae TaxID=3231043 RepID=UPI003461ABD5
MKNQKRKKTKLKIEKINVTKLNSQSLIKIIGGESNSGNGGGGGITNGDTATG